MIIMFVISPKTKQNNTTIQRSADKDQERQWRTTKKSRITNIGDVDDVNRRKSISMVALNKLNNVWIRKDKIKLTTRIKLYNALSKSLLEASGGTVACVKLS